MPDYSMTREMDDIAHLIEGAVSNEDIPALAGICVHLRAKAEWWRGVAQERERLITVLLPLVGPAAAEKSEPRDAKAHT